MKAMMKAAMKKAMMLVLALAAVFSVMMFTPKTAEAAVDYSGRYMIQTALGDRVLDIAGASKKNGANLQIYKDNGTDAQRFLIMIAHTLVAACVRADGPRDKRQRVTFQNDLQRFPGVALFHRVQVRGNILMNRAAVRARRIEAIDERHLLLHLSRRQRLHRLFVIRVFFGVRRQYLDRRDIDAAKCGEGSLTKHGGDL